jgi:predicted Zn-dependent peptidase
MKKILKVSTLATLAMSCFGWAYAGSVAGEPTAPVQAKANAAVAGQFNLPQFETTRMANGLTLVLMERHNAPLITLGVVVKTGAIHDAAQSGLANLTNQAVRLGTNRFPKAVVDQTFDFQGALLGARGDSDQSALLADFAAADFDKLAPIMADLMQNPSFEPAEFDKLRARLLANLKRAKESPNNVADLYFQKMLFGSKPYGNPLIGTESAMAAIKVDDVSRFHKTWYRPDNAAVIVIGDFKLAAMREQIGKLFGAWQAPASALPDVGPLGEVSMPQARVWLVNKNDAHETTFLFGGKGIARNDPDYVPLQVINTILGGRFTSWLNDELRVNSGLSYGANSEFSTLAQNGSFAVSSYTAIEKSDAALALAMRTYQRLWDKGIDSATLASAKAYVKGQYPPRFETNQQLAVLLAEMFTAKVGREQIDHFSSDVDSLNLARCKELINRHFPRDKLQMLLIGKADVIRTLAAKYGAVREIEIIADGFGPQE